MRGEGGRVVAAPVMAGWAGFSEEELRRMKHQKEPSESHRRPPSTNKSRQQLQREKVLQQQIQKAGHADGQTMALPEEQLSTPRPNPVPSNPKANQQPTVAHQQTTSPGVHQPKVVHDSHQNSAETEHVMKYFDLEQHSKTDSKGELELRDKTRLDHLQLEQRLMQEKNKRKKALLAKAIAERSKKTQAETVRLRRIQKELQALDDMVSTDIGILRNRIDQACADFSYAKKRFDKAEAEYLASKLDLHRKTEIKEQLAEHLCTIIQQNELRKAKKLEELMLQLDVETDEEKLELEIEVEQMLQQQEIEARRQALLVNTVATEQAAEETPVLTFTEKENEDKPALAHALEKKKVNVSLETVPSDH
ncbi:RAB6-interacting golgin isoform X1 [Pleurodeles waltl]|uniref:RAB6-interacting golgin isoform X1 n=2 Tax=Pleurodeles waltl TaxID=8319 RepID=UPI003709597A